MIDTKELRIGNYVCDPILGNVQVTKVCPDHVRAHAKNMKIDGVIENVEYPLFDAKPIKLTEDILGKLLPKASDKEYRIEIPVDWSKTHHTDYWFIVKWFEWIATGDYHVGWRPYIKKCKEPVEEIFLWGYLETVHQLQNFYYALTMSELNYQPNQSR